MIFGLIGGAVLGLVCAVVATPRRVEYVEIIDVDAPPRAVFDAIRMQRDLMRWSAWPSETGSTCRAVGDDGTVGAQTEFFDKKGQRFGHQEVAAMEPDRLVRFTLESKGPPHIPVLDFHLMPIEPHQTRVLLAFRNDITPPFHLALRLFGVVRWTRDMHRKDLDGLKRFLERSEDYLGQQLVPAA
ncbi:MAG: SRPBCC family protein [Pseudomonadota bacterium]